LPSGHPLEGKFYEDIAVEIHGGLTYSESTDKGYIIGFDCAHSGDVVPFSSNGFGKSYMDDVLKKKYNKRKSVYRNIEFVKNELKNLVTKILQYKK
jgi:hypothetical protein